jgi:glycosyltransferase involved in cell wall biosynthesis
VDIVSKKWIVISANAAWNIWNFRRNIVSALREEGFDVAVMAPPDEYVSKLEALGCRFIPVAIENSGTNPAKDIVLALRYYSELRRLKPAAFLGFTIKPNVYGSIACHGLGIPTLNNISGLGTTFIRSDWLTMVARQLYKLALSRSHTVFFENHDDRDLFVEGELVASHRTSLLPGCGIRLDEYPTPALPSATVGSGIRFLLIARLIFDKGVREFVHAARLLRKECPDARCALLGFLDVENRTAVSRADVDAWVAEGIVEYLGVTDDVRPYIAAADCVVLPSYREGTPRTLLEAAAMARPLIATDVPGCREVVDDGVNGFRCEVRNARDLADKMRTMIEMTDIERAAMGHAGRSKMEREFDERIVINSYIDVLSECVNNWPNKARKA